MLFALRVVLEALRKESGSKLYYFGVTALDQFKNKLKQYPRYCHSIMTQVPHFQQLPRHIIDVSSGFLIPDSMTVGLILGGDLWRSKRGSTFQSDQKRNASGACFVDDGQSPNANDGFPNGRHGYHTSSDRHFNYCGDYLIGNWKRHEFSG